MLHEMLRGLVAQAADGSGITSLIFPLAIFAIFYFLILRPQQKQQKDQQALIASLKKGDEVITQGGMIGEIYAVTDKIVTLEIAKGVRIRVLKSFVQARTEPAGTQETEKKDAVVEEKKEGK